ncbi:MAG TPA: DNA-processing protein DprA [Anaerolineae bacterium]|nr:DNA-processing protein DprA [Anaerolineae bacterium]
MHDVKYWLAFSRVKGIGPARFQSLQRYFGNLEEAWRADEKGWRAAGLDSRCCQAVREAQKMGDVEAYWERVQARGIKVLTWDCPEYPSRLREVHQVAPVLYYQGEWAAADEWSLAIVGTRRMSDYGRQVTQELVSELVGQGITIVSGLARGIDGVAHKTAIAAGGRTIAVMGTGLDRVYPYEHRGLASRIGGGGGVLLSEYGLDTEPDAYHFPQRNRLISGLSLGVVVIEAGERSGALITADFALEQDRELFAVPGSIFSGVSRGPHKLLQNGAKLVTKVSDILEEIEVAMTTQKVAQTVARQLPLPESAAEVALWQALTGRPQHIDQLGRAAGLSTAVVNSTLTLMELKGMVRQIGGMKYIRVGAK